MTERFAFYYKFLLDPQGGGFDHDPDVRARAAHAGGPHPRADRRRGHCSGTRRSTPWPTSRCAAMVSILFSENHQTQTGTIVGTVPGEWVWPYRHQRYDGLIARLQPA